MEPLGSDFQFPLLFLSGAFCGAFVLLLAIKFKGNNDIKPKNKDVSPSDNSVVPVQDSSGDMKMVLVVRNDLKMGKGKVAAQCSHAAVMAYEIASKKVPEMWKTWKRHGQRKIVLKVESEDDLLKLADSAKNAGLVYAVVVDAGLTQITPGSKTVLAVGPGPEILVDRITGHLKLF